MNLNEIQALDEQYYMNTFGKRLPVAFDHGQGVTLYDTEGRAYTDFFAGIAVNALGYNHPAVTKAIVEQAGKVCHTSNLYYIEPQAKLAKLLCENSFADKVFLGNSGAEANEGAMKLAVKYFYEKGEDRYEILTARNSFHGRTLATIAATGQEKYQKPYAKLLPPCVRNVPFGDLAALRAAATPHTAAVMLEVIQAEGGVVVGEMDYIQGVRALCDELGRIQVFLEEDGLYVPAFSCDVSGVPGYEFQYYSYSDPYTQERFLLQDGRLGLVCMGGLDTLTLIVADGTGVLGSWELGLTNEQLSILYFGLEPSAQAEGDGDHIFSTEAGLGPRRRTT